MLQKLIRYLKKDYNWILFLILILAGILRFSGTNPGYPPYHSDEGMSYSQGIAIIREGTLDAHGYSFSYAYPNLIPLINAVFFKFIFIPLAWVKFYLTNAGKVIDGFIHIPPTADEYRRIFQLEILGIREVNALFWGRYVTALIGTGVVFLTYLVGKKLFNLKVGLLSASLVAVNYREVLNSHIGLPDIYNAFFLLLAFLAALVLWERPTLKRYFIAAVVAGISFSTKYQFFSLVPLFFVHIDLSFKIPSLKERVRHLFSPAALLVPFVVILVFLLLNPYHIVNLEEMVQQVTGVSLKYAVGRMTLDFYPISYLYHIGVGRLTSLLVVLGTILALFRHLKKAGLLLSVILPFFFVFIYYTRGGFYTRNFVTIIPFLLIFAGFVLSLTLNLKPRGVRYLLFIFLLLPTLWENVSKSTVVASAYSKPWNFEVLSEWVSQNIPAASRVAAHSSVPLPVKDVKRLPYDFYPAFSLEEFREMGADYAIANLDWATNDFYWWMTRPTKDSLRYWSKPVEIMEEMYPALAIRELTDFAFYWVLNPWQAPDSGFIVAKVPRYEILKEELVRSFDFEDGEEGWQKRGQLWYGDENLSWEEGYLVIKQGSANSPVLRWESEPILVKDWPGFLIRAKIRTQSDNLRQEGFIAVSFYKSLEDAQGGKNRIAVRVSSRNSILNEWTEKELVGVVPKEARFMRVRFQSYNPNQAEVYLDELGVYKANIAVDYGDVLIRPLDLDANLLFPFSHGGL